MVGELNRLVGKTMHSLVNKLSMLLVTTVNVQLVLSCAVQPASNAVVEKSQRFPWIIKAITCDQDSKSYYVLVLVPKMTYYCQWDIKFYK